MQNALASSSVAAANRNAAFTVQPFADGPAPIPTIKLADIGSDSSVTAAQHVKVKKVSAKAAKKAAVEQVVAEGLELAKMHDKYSDEYVVRGNKALYEVLAAIYTYALQINVSTFKVEIIERMNKALKDDYGIKTTTKTHWLTTVIKLIVKGTDRQTASNYSRVMQIALNENLAANELANYIERRGGVANIRATEAASVAVSSAKDIADIRGQLVKDYFVATAMQSHTSIVCDMESQVWGGDGSKPKVDSKPAVGRFSFFITINEGGNKYRVVEHAILSEVFENEFMRQVARTFNQSTEEMQKELDAIKAENAELLKKANFAKLQFDKLFEAV